MDKKNIIKLNLMEEIFYKLNLQGDESVICFAYIDLENDNTQFTKAIVVEALSYMYKRHPFFRAHIRTSQPNELYLELLSETDQNLDKIDFGWVTLDTGNEQLTRELEKFNMEFFDYQNNCLLWRFRVYEYQCGDGKTKLAFALVIPHFITDGINISTLLMEIVNLVNALLTGQECEEMNRILEPISDLITLSEQSNLLNEETEMLIQEALKNDEQFFFTFDQKLYNPNDLGVKINTLALDETTSKSLIHHAKLNKVKLNGFLVAAAFYAVKQLYDENGLTLPNNITTNIPVNIRMRLTPNVGFSDLRLLITAARINLTYPEFGKYEDIWKDAVFINNISQDETRTDNGALFKRYFKAKERFRSLGDSSAKQSDEKPTEDIKTKFDVVFSNIGTFLNEKQLLSGPLKISEIYHGDSLQSFPSFIASLIIHTTTWNNRLMFQFSSNRRTFSTRHSDRLVEIFEKTLRNSINS